MLTTRFNQDAIENFFASVRSKGFNNDTKTSSEYESSVKNIAVNWLLEQPAGTKCADEGDFFLSMMEHITVKKSTLNQDGTDSELHEAHCLSFDIQSLSGDYDKAAPSNLDDSCSLD